jgi:hypothetical protein
MAFRVARELGMLVGDLMDRCSAQELRQWGYYLSLTADDFKSTKTVERQLLDYFGESHGKSR